MNTKTNIQIEKSTRLELISISHKDESYDDIIRKLISLKKGQVKP